MGDENEIVKVDAQSQEKAEKLKETANEYFKSNYSYTILLFYLNLI